MSRPTPGVLLLARIPVTLYQPLTREDIMSAKYTLIAQLLGLVLICGCAHHPRVDREADERGNAVWAKEQAEVRGELLQLTKELKFNDAEQFVSRRSADLLRFPTGVVPPAARASWFAAHRAALAAAVKYHNLVADRQEKLAKNPDGDEKTSNMWRIEDDLVPRNRHLKPYRFRKVRFQRGDKVGIKSVLRYSMVVVVFRRNRAGKLAPVGTETVPLLEAIRLGVFDKIAKAAWAESGGDSADLHRLRVCHGYYVQEQKIRQRLETASEDPHARFLLQELQAVERAGKKHQP